MKRLTSLLLVLALLSSVTLLAQDWGKMAKKVTAENAVEILGTFQDKPGVMLRCTGIVVDINTVLTANHCLAQGFAALSVEGRETVLLGAVEGADLALLQVPLVGKKPIDLAPQSPENGEPVLAIGYGMDLVGASATAGHVLNVNLGEGFIRFDQPILPGYSGGPLVNLKGQLVGVDVRTSFDLSYGLAVPVEWVKVFMQMVRVHMVDAPPTLADLLNAILQ